MQLPVRVFSHDATPATQTATVSLPGGVDADWLYAQIHNVRAGGQVSLRVNDGEWTHLYNHSVQIAEPERSQGGIGGNNGTLRFMIPLPDGLAAAGASNDVAFRLNGSDGVVSGIRVVDFDFLDSNGNRLLAPTELTLEDPSTWAPPSSLPADITAGQALWQGGALVNDSVNQTPIQAHCASCHFEDGSDLKYFNYSNESIVIRSMFHGLTQQEGEQIASYIRTRSTPTPGRPWNPPFQPGPDLDPDPLVDSSTVRAEKAESWMAGAGLEWVVEDESAILPHVFPGGLTSASIAKVMDHEETFSVREVPIPIQFPDWNHWLPDIAPEDIWSPSAYYNGEPYTLYNTLRTTVTTQGAAALTAAGNLNKVFTDFNHGLRLWFGGDFRLVDQNPANESAVSLARNPGLTREQSVQALVKWMAIKMLAVVRDFDLEAEQDAASAMQGKGHPMFQPELLSIPGGQRLSIVFAHAPHIISDNWANFAWQPEPIGKMESNQWYHLQLCLNSGYRMQVGMNVPLDWAYQINHLESASLRASRWYGVQRLITQIKMLQIRRTGRGLQQGGFSQRTLHPWRFYSTNFADRSLLKGQLEDIAPGLWNQVFEAYLREWLDIVQSYDLATMPRSDTDRHQFETASYVPVPWPGGNAKFFNQPGEIQADALYRLIPLLAQEGIDEMLLLDLMEWCKRAWPYNAGTWGSTPDWDSLLTPTSLYAETFEDAVSDFDVINAALVPRSIKNANYVNANGNVPRNGGGAWVAERGVNPNVTRQGIHDSISIPVSGIQRLRLKARVAFRDNDNSDPGLMQFRMRARFNHSGATYEAEDTLTLDPELYGEKFEDYVSHINVPAGASDLIWLALRWERVGGVGAGTVYVDNVHLLSTDTPADTTPPPAPVLTNLTRPASLHMRCNWSDTSSPSDGVIGYHVYRWVNGEPESTKVRLNTGLVDNPYIRFDDFTAARGIGYRYHITAVDAAGNESAPSVSRTQTLPDTTPPATPTPLWARNASGSVDLGWFGVRDWDVAGYDVYRRITGDPTFTRITPPTDPAGAWLLQDPTAIDGLSYDYYVQAFDGLGNLSSPSAVITLVSGSGVTHVGAWKVAFNGSNGWDHSDAGIAGNGLDPDLDGVKTLFEYLRGENPSLADSTPEGVIGGSRTSISNQDYLQIRYLRQQDLPPGIVVKMLGSNDLQSWPGEFTIEGDTRSAGIVVTEGPPTGGQRTVTVRQTLPVGSPGAYRFMKIEVEER